MKRTTILGICITALVALAAWAPSANAYSSFYNNNCGGCHGSTSGVAPYSSNTCAGCHAHGVHPDSGKDSMNITATPDNTTYNPGDTILVEVGGGYRGGWVRVQMWDLDCSVADTCTQGNVLDSESLYTSGSTVSFPGPVTLTATAPATPGDYTWYAGWYGNEFDESGAAIGLWITDSTNSGHGNELVAFSFTVTEEPECSVDLDCDDNQFCNGAETCDTTTGTCQPGTVVDCSDGVSCTDDTCNEVSDTCLNTPNNANCADDGQFCNGVEVCNLFTDCTSQGDPCAPGTTCNEDTDTCAQQAQCGDGVIDSGEDCDEGSANGSTPCGCQADCTLPSAGTSCADGEFCNGDETCNGAGACQAGTPVVCDDGVGCTDDSCDEGSDSCENTPNNGNCPDDGQFCTGSEFCDPVNDCSSTGDPCSPGDTCDEGTDVCVAPPVVVDLDIARFSATKSIRLARVKPVTIKLVVKNNGTANAQTRPAIVSGWQNGGEVYTETQQVDASKGRSTFNFGPYTPTAPGEIMWTVIISDDDPDIDQATAFTSVK